VEFLRVHFVAVPKPERQKVREQLERYCGLDTKGMIWIVEALRQIVVSLRYGRKSGIQ
jgi:hypothetical protein